MAEIMRQIAADEALRTRFSDNARRYYQEYFRKEQFFNMLETVLQENCV